MGAALGSKVNGRVNPSIMNLFMRNCLILGMKTFHSCVLLSLTADGVPDHRHHAA
jgi:hypothetical protein